MKKRTLLLILVVLLLSSCSRVTLVRREHWESVVNSIDTLQMSMASLDSLIRMSSEQSKAANIEQEFATLRIEEKIEQISRDVSQSQERITEISRKTGKISAHIREQQVQDSLRAIQDDEDKVASFTYAQQEFQGGHLQEAYDAFENYMKTYPDDARTPEALYWRAEAAFGLEQFTIAEALFKQYYSSYRDGEQICSILYRWGFMYDTMKEDARRDYVWKQLFDTCPNSRETKLAQVRIAENKKTSSQK